VAKKTDTDNFKEYFDNKPVITLHDIENYYRISEPAIPKTTVNWRVHNLVHSGVLQRIGKGLYRFGKTKNFVQQTKKKKKKIEVFLQKKFPFVRYCQWDLSHINSFSHHLINYNVLFVDVEKDAVDAVYYALKENFVKVMAIKNLYDDLSEFNNYFFVRPLITEAPIQKTKNIFTATLEKTLVDLAVDKEFFSFQGNEIFTIFHTAFERYTINQNTLFRYAARKNKKEEIKNIITINRQ
jgi:hypothetical protein